METINPSTAMGHWLVFFAVLSFIVGFIESWVFSLRNAGLGFVGNLVIGVMGAELASLLGVIIAFVFLDFVLPGEVVAGGVTILGLIIALPLPLTGTIGGGWLLLRVTKRTLARRKEG